MRTASYDLFTQNKKHTKSMYQFFLAFKFIDISLLADSNETNWKEWKITQKTEYSHYYMEWSRITREIKQKLTHISLSSAILKCLGFNCPVDASQADSEADVSGQLLALVMNTKNNSRDENSQKHKQTNPKTKGRNWV